MVNTRAQGKGKGKGHGGTNSDSSNGNKKKKGGSGGGIGGIGSGSSSFYDEHIDNANEIAPYHLLPAALSCLFHWVTAHPKVTSFVHMYLLYSYIFGCT